jgi:hypothetical protein
MPLTKNNPPDQKSLKEFSSKVNFKLPQGYLEFMSNSNGAEGQLASSYFILWSIDELFDLNEQYHVDEFAPGFFIIGSDGGDTAFAIDKRTGELYDMPFVGMSREEATLRARDFPGLLETLNESPA